MSCFNQVSMMALASTFCLISCGSGSGGDNGNQGKKPVLDLAPPNGFKNTVSVAGLSDKLNALSGMQSKIEGNLNIPAKSKSLGNLNRGAFLQSVQGFMDQGKKSSAFSSLLLQNVIPFKTLDMIPDDDESDGDDSDKPSMSNLTHPEQSLDGVSEGMMCDEAMSSIANTYKSATTGLQMAASGMVKALESNETLPEGVTKFGKTDQYAGGFRVDLSQYKLGEELDQKIKKSGTLEMKAGADDRYVIFEMGANNVNLSMAADEEKGGGNLKVSASGKMIGDLTEENIQSQQKFDLNLKVDCQNRSDGQASIDLNAGQDTTVAGGATPNVNDKFTLQAKVNSPCSDQKGSLAVNLAANFNAVQQDVNTLKVGIDFDVSGKGPDGKPVQEKNKFEFVMTRDNMGSCKVSQASLNGKPISADDGDGEDGTGRGRGGIKR